MKEQVVHLMPVTSGAKSINDQVAEQRTLVRAVLGTAFVPVELIEPGAGDVTLSKLARCLNRHSCRFVYVAAAGLTAAARERLARTSASHGAHLVVVYGATGPTTSTVDLGRSTSP